jgi:hypothetical protein|tara:strand:+ start:1133 stop:1945 length:813 start_codon:yes stop_codon:yes gene_type:complete
MKNLVLTAAFGLDISQVELFVKSLRKYYKDEIYFLIGPEDIGLKEKLKIYNCNFFIAKANKKEISTKRFNFFVEFLKKNKFKNVFCCDSRDVYFQANPFDFSYKGEINFFLEDKKIKDCPINSKWIIRAYGEKVLNDIGEETILCAGTVMGTQQKVIEYLSLVVKQISTVKYKKRLKYLLTFRPDKEGRGVDQGHANYLVRKNFIENCSFSSNGKGPVATVFYLKNILFDKNMRLLNILQEPYAVVHQYDKRWSEFSFAVNKMKKDLNIS